MSNTYHTQSREGLKISGTPYHPQPPPRASKKPLTVVAQFDDLVRNGNVLTAGQEEELLSILRQQDRARKAWLSLSEEHERCDAQARRLGSERTALETQLKHARNQINLELERRLTAERARDSLERQIGLIRELLVDKKNNSIMTDFDRERLAPVLTSTSSLLSLGKTDSLAPPGNAALHLGQGGAPPIRTTPKRLLDTINESSNSILDDDISYDKTEEEEALTSGLQGDTFNISARRASGGKRRKSGRRSGKRPSAPSLDDIEDENLTGKKVPKSGVLSPLVALGFENINASVATHADPRQISRPVAPRDEDQESVDSFWGVGATTASAADAPIAITNRTPVGLLTVLTATPTGNPKNVSTPKSGPASGTAPPRGLSPGVAPARGGLARPHAFVQKTIVKMETCIPCGKRITFGKIAHKCRDCRSICHPECRDMVPVPCIAAQSAAPRGVAPGLLADHAPLEAPMIPALVVHCIKEIEARGLTEQGIYRVPGSDSMVKDLAEKFLRGRGVPNLSRIEDIHVVCSCLKHFLRKLKEPVTTYGLWGSFVRAAEIYKMGDIEHAVTMVQDTMTHLPHPNRDTLAFLILHLVRVSQSPATKMPVHNLAKVFGPTIIGYSSAEPEALQMLNEPKKQADVLELMMLGVDVGFWEDVIKPAGDENLLPSTPDTPDLTIRLGNRLGTLTTPEGESGNIATSLSRATSGTAGSLNRLFGRTGKTSSTKKAKNANNFHASPQLK